MKEMFLDKMGREIIDFIKMLANPRTAIKIMIALAIIVFFYFIDHDNTVMALQYLFEQKWLDASRAIFPCSMQVSYWLFGVGSILWICWMQWGNKRTQNAMIYIAGILCVVVVFVVFIAFIHLLLLGDGSLLSRTIELPEGLIIWSTASFVVFMEITAG